MKERSEFVGIVDTRMLTDIAVERMVEENITPQLDAPHWDDLHRDTDFTELLCQKLRNTNRSWVRIRRKCFDRERNLGRTVAADQRPSFFDATTSERHSKCRE